MVAIRAKTSVKLRLQAECPSHARSIVSVRDVTFSIDEPVERGGTNTGPTPTETLIAALVGCINVIGSKCADKLGVDIGHLTISATCDFDRRGVTLAEEIDVPFQRIELAITYDGSASEAEVAQVTAELNKFCPLSKLFVQAGTELIQTWTPKA
ncbi:MAG: OsmC family protein [Alphaproteobacteria bacterium]